MSNLVAAGSRSQLPVVNEATISQRGEILFNLAVECGKRRDTEGEIKYLKASTELECGRALYALGACCRGGFGVKRDLVAAFQYVERAANQNLPIAQLILARMYRLGQGTQPNFKKALRWYKIVADRDQAIFQQEQNGVGPNSNLPLPQRDNKSPSFDTFCWASNNFRLAQYYTACAYYSGEFVAQNMTEAVKYYKLAADNNFAPAQARLGFCFRNGQGVRNNDKEAFKYFRLGADQGDMNGQYWTGVCYQNGIGTVKNRTESIKYLKMAADQGDAKSLFFVGLGHWYGFGAVKCDFKAFKYFKMSADQNDARAQCHVGLCYAGGHGVAKDEKKAMKFLTLAVNQNDDIAQYEIGRFYEVGRCVDRNIETAFYWYKLSAGNGFAEAQNALGQCHEHGLGTSVNLQEALKYYQLASDKGNNLAKVRIKALKEKMNSGEELTSHPAVKRDIQVLTDPVEIQDKYECCLSLCIMMDPVLCMDGRTYERAAIEAWLVNHDSSPWTRQLLTSKELIPNDELREEIQEYLRQQQQQQQDDPLKSSAHEELKDGNEEIDNDNEDDDVKGDDDDQVQQGGDKKKKKKKKGKSKGGKKR